MATKTFTNTTAENALQMLRFLPRISCENLVKNPYARNKKRKRVGKYGRRGRLGYGQKGMLQRQKYLPLGMEIQVVKTDPRPNKIIIRTTPWHIRHPREWYYKGILDRRQYPPLSLYELQLLIDTGKINPDEPIDLATLCNTNCYHINPLDKHYGIHLTDDGLDVFTAKINIEVQHAKEQVIAAIERNGGVITTAFYDIKSVMALADPLKFFKSGEPIPRRLLPPPDCIEYYSNPKNRGYLADPEKVAEERFLLSQKYGYKLADLKIDPLYKTLTLRKDPRQVFYGLEPGWVVNLKDKEILKPSDKLLQEYYKS
ncbi:39S ribosomal protein L15: mitochondrial-like isoform X2 [Dinothrombium tinctorium]|uniref:Large ribosomal subunit protein uL15m n=1 Tax=Dinothrombium tinctorium TaxID=1965070 RepID=A0A3S3SNB3_9ACAR|nr:39S ribosomal protein L15: mitochondrial-like isoform X2 [Dinothrombium tinctorium]